jgi:hypothetical protein
VVNVELRLLAHMLYTGDFRPIQSGDVPHDLMLTEQGQIVHSFITNYRSSTDGAARFPSLSVVRGRFYGSAVELPDPDPADTLEALVYETQTQKMKARIKELSIKLDELSSSSDGLVEPLINVQGEMRKMTDKLQRSKHVSLANGIDEVLQDYDTGMLIPNGIPWPWPSMTKATKGIQRGEWTIIAGRPKSRKTFTALSIAAYAFRHHHARVLIFTPEMKRKMILLRTIAFLCQLRYTEFKDTALDELETMRLIEAARTYGRFPSDTDESYSFRLHNRIHDLPPMAAPSIDIIESVGRSVSWMESQIELFNPDIVIADSFYRQNPDGGKRNDSDHKVMTALSRSLKDLAMSTNVAMIGTHQLNRDAEGKVGGLSNLGYSDAFGQDLDNGLRVITGKVEGNDVSALVMLGGREVPFPGILINNVPCCDFSEIGPITNMKTVTALMKQEEDEEAEEEAREAKKKASNFGTRKSVNDRMVKTMGKREPLAEDFAAATALGTEEEDVSDEEAVAVSEGEQ